MDVRRRGRHDAAERHRRHARETVEALQRLSESAGGHEDVIHLHELHARHERELGHDENAARAEQRARTARRRSLQ